MIALLFHIRCLLLFFAFIQSVSLYKIYAFDNNQPDLSSLFVNDELNPSIQNRHMPGYENIGLNSNNKDISEELKSKRSMSLSGLKPMPQRRNNRQHWNPLVAAYKRCGELVNREERESCFKDAVQMLFVHKIRK